MSSSWGVERVLKFESEAYWRVFGSISEGLYDWEDERLSERLRG